MPNGGSTPLEKVHVFHPDAILENLTDVKIRYDCDRSNLLCRIGQNQSGGNQLKLAKLEIVDEVCQKKEKMFVPPIACDLGSEFLPITM